ncbi:hypothetical protein KI387_036278, partial [Taxus chinensis]
MAFYGSAADLTNEKAEERAQSFSGINLRLDGSSSDNDKDKDYPSEDIVAHDALGGRGRGQGQGHPLPLRRMVGKWGSGFWKDRQMVNIEDGSTSESEKDSKKSDADFQVDKGGGSEDNAFDVGEGEEDYYNYNKGGQNLRDQTEVSVEEMLSDDYYEQGGEERNHSISGNRVRSIDSRFPARATNGNKNLSKRVKVVESDDDYEYHEHEEDNEEDEDDPHDADFVPISTGGCRSWRQSRKVELSESEEYVEEGENEDAGFSDSDEDFTGCSYQASRRVTRASQSGRGTKCFIGSTRPKRRRMVSEEDESSAQDTDKDSDEDFYRPSMKVASFHKKGGVRQTTSVSKDLPSSELRSSTRLVRKISYAESEESAGEEEERAKRRVKISMEDVDEDDADAIERVLWHQRKGMVQAARAENWQPDPVVFTTSIDGDLDWNETDFLIKLKGQSYLHCQWQTLADLQHLSGFKKVLNYMKKVEEELNFRQALSREEAEVHDVGKEMELDLLNQYRQVERVFADRTIKIDSDEEVQNYLVKWKGLSYAEATWEKDTDIPFAQDAIDEYKNREATMTVQGKMVDAQRKKSKGSLRKLDEQPDWLKGGKLRDYQLEGLNFLVNSWRNDTNVILADEMGLGKTVQSVSVLGFLQNAQQIEGPFLVVVPLSTITNWAKEFRKWLPDMNVVVYVGNRASREVCQQFEFYTNKKTGRSIKFNALLTTYEVVLKDKHTLSKIKWNYLMVDEAHRLKNCEASLYTSLCEFSTKNKLLITGTPLQNSVEELWALLHFLDQDKFRNRDEFVEKYKDLSSVTENELANLHRELRPHILRRVIKDVEKSLPPKIERILRVEMSPLQKQYYKWILERNFHDLNKGVRGNQVSLLNVVVELKKCCNHPFLFESADYGYGGDANMNDSSKVQRLILSSGKLAILDKLLVRLRETKHRVLIFSQMVRMLDILADYFTLRGFQYQRLDGSTRADLRHQAMEHFNAPSSEDFCFLLSTRAGGLGINLATADTVIIFDSDWNPQNDLQAMSRAHRIGQQEVVNVYRFVTSKSVEEDILERAKQKMVLDHLVIQKLNAQGRLEKKDPKKGTSMFDKNELSAILRFGAEELFKEDKNEEEAKRKLENMDIDEILARAEKVESKGIDEQDGTELLSAFKVASFSNPEDDGTFWSRLIHPEAISQAEESLAPRAARNTKSYAEVSQPDRHGKRRKRGGEVHERVSKRSVKVSEAPLQLLPRIEGAVGYVCEWAGGGLSKKDANNFVKAVKKFGDSSRISSIAAEVGGSIESATSRAQVELFNALVNGCKDVFKRGDGEGKGVILDFFGVAVKAQEFAERVRELQLLSKRIKRFQDPVVQFRLKTHPRNPSWSKSCSWNQVDDARLLLGVHYHGYGNWEKIRTDCRFGLAGKIAPAGLSASETFLPRAPHLDARASALLRKEFESEKESNTKILSIEKPNAKGERDPPKTSVGDFKEGHGKSNHLKQWIKPNREHPQKRLKIESRVKEEGEISESEEPQYQRYREKIDQETKEERWREWCADVMYDQLRTLKRLQKLQATSVDLPKEEVLYKVKNYLQLLGRKIDVILKEHSNSRNYSRMVTRLWNYVATFSNLSGERLSEIYKKLTQEAHQDTGVSTENNIFAPRLNGRDSDPSQSALFSGDHHNAHRYPTVEPHPAGTFDRDQETGKSEAWKRRRRIGIYDESGALESMERPSVGSYVPHGVSSNGNRLHDSSSAGILGCAPGEQRMFGERWNRPHSNYPLPGQEFGMP